MYMAAEISVALEYLHKIEITLPVILTAEFTIDHKQYWSINSSIRVAWVAPRATMKTKASLLDINLFFHLNKK